MSTSDKKDNKMTNKAFKFELTDNEVTVTDGKVAIEVVSKLPDTRKEDPDQPMTAEEIVRAVVTTINSNKEAYHGQTVCINGPMTVPEAIVLGHELAHVCKEVWMYVPMERKYIKVLGH